MVIPRHRTPIKVRLLIILLIFCQLKKRGLKLPKMAQMIIKNTRRAGAGVRDFEKRFIIFIKRLVFLPVEFTLSHLLIYSHF
jgi:hypothetical protein